MNNNLSEIKQRVIIDDDESETGEEYYDVEEILDKKKFGSIWKYKIKWVGFSDDTCTWEPKDNLNCTKIVEDFDIKWGEEHPCESPKISVEKRGRPRKFPIKQITSYSVNENIDYYHGSINPVKLCLRKRGRPKKLPISTDNSLKICNKFDKSFYNEFNSDLLSNDSNHAINIKNVDESNILNSIKEEKGNVLVEMSHPEGNLSEDVPIRIINGKKVENGISFIVEWGIRSDGYKPDNSGTLNHDLRKICPDLMLDYYESKLRFNDE